MLDITPAMSAELKGFEIRRAYVSSPLLQGRLARYSNLCRSCRCELLCLSQRKLGDEKSVVPGLVDLTLFSNHFWFRRWVADSGVDGLLPYLGGLYGNRSVKFAMFRLRDFERQTLIVELFVWRLAEICVKGVYKRTTERKRSSWGGVLKNA